MSRSLVVQAFGRPPLKAGRTSPGSIGTGAKAAGGGPLSRPPRTREDQNSFPSGWARLLKGTQGAPKGSGSGVAVFALVFGRTTLL